MGKGQKDRKGDGPKKEAENGKKKPQHVPDIPRTDLYSIIKQLKKNLKKLKEFETPKTQKQGKQGRPLMRQLPHAPSRTNEKKSTDGLFSPSDIFTTYKEARQEILNEIHAQSDESGIEKARNSIRETEQQFIVDLGNRVREVARNPDNVETVEEMAGYTKKLYGYLKLLMKAAKKAGFCTEEVYNTQVKALDSSIEGSYADVLKQEQVMIRELRSKQHAFLSEYDANSAMELKKMPTGVEGSDATLKAKLDEDKKTANDDFKIKQQELWTDKSPITKMLACIE